ncbi:PA0069 family radical SAM protein [Pontixanthobacter aestiaquae]|uniref:PA0069 family radical SAM protein n=1 Tax=Pontixanthobacter aestiaquae TaxID=1509367 RepID=A0A844ZA58_9SPHN|nr:PA0069 family radical SAM protein [Pontixanthobacter aestiaquae]MDN3645258.1 PA0069 family radical SAM protein [Pontixanthobacter aestiaquae]MXO83740.1 PA0069 family radical SAM protein [Pontixanthobacter aestiaquae]
MERKKIRGRGAQSSAVPERFGLDQREADGDWRDAMEALDGPPVKLRTTVTEEHPRTILSFNQSPDIPFDRSVNAYRGCEHGCVYCYARPTHAYHDLSPGLDFETKLFAKPDAAKLLRDTLAKPKYRPRWIAMGTNTDPYQPIEARYRITRDILKLCLDTRHPVTITTKSDRVLADLDLLEELAKRNLTAISISVTTLDPRLSSLLEPRASAPRKRLAAIKQLAAAGVPTHCSVSPIIPAITDEFMEEIIAKAGQIGARSAGWIPLRLPHEVAPLFREWLDVHYPDRAGKVMSIVRSIRGGKDNDPNFRTRMKPKGVWADLFRSRFHLACKRAGLISHDNDPKFQLDCSQFRKPEIGGQMRLL